METTVKEFIELLKPYATNKNAIIRTEENENFVHISNLRNGDVIISTKKPIGYCNRSGGYVFLTDVEDYLGVVPELDENVDLSEISLPILKEEENPIKFTEPIEIESKYKQAFYTLLNEVESDLSQKVWDKLYEFDVELEF